MARSLSDISVMDLRQRIDRFKRADWQKLSDGQIRNRIARVIDQYPFQLRKMLLTGVYRARKNCVGQHFAVAGDLWYPPVDKITKAGRLNRIGQVRFYAANAPNTTILELRPSPGDTFTILSAETKSGHPEPLEVAFIGLERSQARETQHLSGEELFRHSQTFRNRFGGNNYRKWLAIDDFLSEIFATPVSDGEEHKYKPTNALADLIFSSGHIDAMCYPSVATNAHGINICFFPERADALFRPLEAWLVRIEEQALHPASNTLLHRFSFLRKSESISPDGKINWLPHGVGQTTEAIGRFTQYRMQSLATMPMPI